MPTKSDSPPSRILSVFLLVVGLVVLAGGLFGWLEPVAQGQPLGMPGPQALGIIIFGAAITLIAVRYSAKKRQD
jgi:hypothetical protein